MAGDRYHKDRIGNRKLRPETLMLGYGYDPALSEGAVKPPVFLTSTFVFTSAEHGKEFFDYVAGRKEPPKGRSEEHTSELQSRQYLVCRLLLEKKKKYSCSIVLAT